MVDEERLIAFSDGEVRGLAGLQRQPFQMIVAEADERLAPILIAREAPDGWAENVVFAAGRIGQKSAALERVRETEGATAIDAEQHGELSKRHGLVGLGDGFQNEEPAVKTLYRWCLERGFLHVRGRIFKLAVFHNISNF